MRRTARVLSSNNIVTLAVARLMEASSSSCCRRAVRYWCRVAYLPSPPFWRCGSASGVGARVIFLMAVRYHITSHHSLLFRIAISRC